MVNLISFTLLPGAILVFHMAAALLGLGLSSRNTYAKKIVKLLGKHSLSIGLLLSLSAISGSLFYSEVVGFEPCVLCWWQRVLLYPLTILFAVAIWRGARDVFKYAVPLATLAVVVAAYQSYVYLGGNSILPCTALGGACSKVYVFAFGYITIPMMSLTIALAILLLAWAKKIYDQDSHA